MIADLEQDQAVIEIIVSGSDRITAIVGGVLLDTALCRTVEERLRDHEDSRRLLCKVGAPLGNLEPKITLGFMLYAFNRKWTAPATWDRERLAVCGVRPEATRAVRWTLFLDLNTLKALSMEGGL